MYDYLQSIYAISGMYDYLQSIHMQSVPIITKVVSLNPADGKMYSIQHYVIKFVSELWQVAGFLLIPPFPTQIKLTATILLKYC